VRLRCEGRWTIPAIRRAGRGLRPAADITDEIVRFFPADERLDAPVTVLPGRTTLAGLLDSLAGQSGVPLAASPGTARDALWNAGRTDTFGVVMEQLARSLEQQWESALRAQRDLREEYERFLNEQAPRLTEEERSRILAVSADIPALWHASETTARDRKEIIRPLTERIVVDVRAHTERAEITITWRGGQTTRHEIVRPVSRSESLGEYDRMMDRIV
jgi:hypothetical protein